MPLHDHFHPPVSNKRHWSELHGGWPGEIARFLFSRTPPGYQAVPRLYLGSSFEVDVSVAREENLSVYEPENGSGGTALLAVESPLTSVTDVFDYDDYEVRIYDETRQRTLVAAIEIVCPSNKDRPETRLQFTSKCLAY